MAGLETTFYRFWGGFAHFPLYLLMSKGDTLQRLFISTFVMVCIGFQLALASAISSVFTIPESNDFWLMMFILITVMYAIYTLLVFLYAKKEFAKLFFIGIRLELLLYIIGALFTYISMSLIISVTFGGIRIILLGFAFWSFFILCFAIINTSEKAKQRYDAEIAREIIASGRKHYKKLSELQHTLQIMRHDFKHNLNTANQMLLSGDRDSAASYLADIQQQFSKNELPRFCTNTVINALLASYAERSAKQEIEFKADISLPDPLTIPDYDMCIILGNLLESTFNICTKENAIRAIDISLGHKGGQMSIVAENTFTESISKENRLLLSENSNDDPGIKSIRTISARYGGEFVTEVYENSFTAYVLMNL